MPKLLRVEHFRWVEWEVPSRAKLEEGSKSSHRVDYVRYNDVITFSHKERDIEEIQNVLQISVVLFKIQWNFENYKTEGSR